jgi:trigger factor
MKRQLLDQLAAKHDFVVPESMVEAEYENIMRQLRHEAGHEADPAAALAEIETEAADYRKIAERRVRLGLLLSDIGQGNNIEISQQEMNRLIGQAAAQYQGKDRERFIQYVQQEPTAAAQLRAPLYEDKVVDWLFSHAEISERAATRSEVEADLESEEGHVHGPDCGHAHAQAAPAAEPVKAKGKGKKAKPAASEAAVAEPAADAAPAEATEAPAEAPAAESKPAKAKPAPKKVKLTEDATDAPKPAKPLKSEPADKAAAAAADDAEPAKKPAKKSGKAAK